MENYRGFVGWLFRGWYRDLTMWGMIIGGVAFLNMLADGSLVATWLLLSLGLGLVLFDLIHKFLAFQYSLYRMERDRVARELERK